MRVSTACVLASIAVTANGFSTMTAFTGSKARASPLFMEKHTEVGSFDPLNFSSEETNDFDFKPAMAALVTMAALAPEANAAGPDWGIFEGRTGSLLHPIIMGSMFVLSASTAIKGFQVRRQRTLGDDISALKKTLPNLNGAASLTAAIAQAVEAEDSALAMKLKAALPLQEEVDALVAERKDLSSKGLKDKHWSQGATLAFMGTAFAIEVSAFILSSARFSRDYFIAIDTFLLFQ